LNIEECVASGSEMLELEIDWFIGGDSTYRDILCQNSLDSGKATGVSKIK